MGGGSSKISPLDKRGNSANYHQELVDHQELIEKVQASQRLNWKQKFSQEQKQMLELEKRQKEIDESVYAEGFDERYDSKDPTPTGSKEPTPTGGNPAFFAHPTIAVMPGEPLLRERLSPVDELLLGNIHLGKKEKETLKKEKEDFDENRRGGGFDEIYDTPRAFQTIDENPLGKRRR